MLYKWHLLPIKSLKMCIGETPRINWSGEAYRLFGRTIGLLLVMLGWTEKGAYSQLIRMTCIRKFMVENCLESFTMFPHNPRFHNIPVPENEEALHIFSSQLYLCYIPLSIAFSSYLMLQDFFFYHFISVWEISFSQFWGIGLLKTNSFNFT